MWIWSVFCRAELELHWMTDLSTFLHNPLFLTRSALCFFSILTCFCWDCCFVPSVSYVYFYLSPSELLSFAPQASELGMLSVYYTYIFTSLVSKWDMLWAFKGNLDFTPAGTHQYSHAELLQCNKIVHCNTSSSLEWMIEWIELSRKQLKLRNFSTASLGGVDFLPHCMWLQIRDMLCL